MLLYSMQSDIVIVRRIDAMGMEEEKDQLVEYVRERLARIKDT
ncbi:hypothetical protein J6TS7_36800 [Paenibacillus dendritiformis]|nr:MULTISPECIES: hypothetical protein [Paenibacillus]MEB9895957.1 hypothetical protein [Bacillus cereus]GIO80070.1 hypothetical protein J6TS7_36800 [Paenibacillus dendritiformis]